MRQRNVSTKRGFSRPITRPGFRQARIERLEQRLALSGASPSAIVAVETAINTASLPPIALPAQVVLTQGPVALSARALAVNGQPPNSPSVVIGDTPFYGMHLDVLGGGAGVLPSETPKPQQDDAASQQASALSSPLSDQPVQHAATDFSPPQSSAAVNPALWSR